jgi:hypothetical protein
MGVTSAKFIYAVSASAEARATDPLAAASNFAACADSRRGCVRDLRALCLPKTVDYAKVEAKFDNGVLKNNRAKEAGCG